MDRIRHLWDAFSSTEKRYLRVYLEAFHRGSENTALRLIQLLGKTRSQSGKKLREALWEKH
ncbi:MAG: hypothetical protein R3B47_20705 [Bacteroidia bacterium]